MRAALAAIAVLAAIGAAGAPRSAERPVDRGRAAPTALSPTCLGCHASFGADADVPANRGRIAHAGDDRVGASAARRTGTPDVVIIGDLANLYGAVVFDHRVHADMSQIAGGCVNCHHHAPEGSPVSACRECHAPERSAGTPTHPSLKGAYHRQCLSCHRDWSHENACGFCHTEQAATGGARVVDASALAHTRFPRLEPSATYRYETPQAPAALVSFQHRDHAQSFGLQCVDCHRAGSCAGCHDGSQGPQESMHRMDSCRSCHAVNACGFCHDQQPRPPFDHAVATGWDPGPQHQHTPCVSCHGRVEAFLRPLSNCRGCHGGLDPQTFDHRITGVPLEGSHAQFACVRCHDASRAEAPATCHGCHADRSYPPQTPGQRN